MKKEKKISSTQAYASEAKIRRVLGKYKRSVSQYYSGLSDKDNLIDNGTFCYRKTRHKGA